MQLPPFRIPVRGGEGYRASVERSPRTSVISRNGTGVDNIDLAAAQALGIRILRAEGANARGVAD